MKIVSYLLVFFLGICTSSSLIQLKLIVVLLSMIVLILRTWNIRISKNIFLLLMIFVSFLCLSILVGLLRAEISISLSMREAANMAFVGYVVCFFTILLRKFPKVLFDSVTLVYNCILLYSSIKVGLIALSVVGLVSTNSIIELIGGIGANIVAHSFGGSNGALRLQSGNDIVALFSFVLMPIVGWRISFSKSFKVLFSIIVGLSLVLTLARYIWLVLVFWFVFFTFVDSETFHVRRNIDAALRVFFLVIIIGGMLGLLYSNSNLGEIVRARLFDSSSNKNKVEQTGILLEYWTRAPILGHGLGSYVPHYIRNSELPFLYENQVASFFVQFGVVGVCIMGFLVLDLYKLLLPRSMMSIRTSKIYILISLILFVISGIFNPYLISLNSSLIYFLFYFVAVYCTKRNTAE